VDPSKTLDCPLGENQAVSNSCGCAVNGGGAGHATDVSSLDVANEGRVVQSKK
jgi:hypothetical protein